MKNIAEILKDIDWDKLGKEFAEERQKETEQREAFWNSTLCHTMIEDMKRVNQGFDAEGFSYFPEQIKSRFGWENISDDDINQFINVMSDSLLGIDEKIEQEIDEDCIFDNYSFIKKGIVISIMHGQGTAIYLAPETACSPE
jgi:hypothetical protein